MSREWTVTEQIHIPTTPADAYRAVADPKRMPDWSPECVGVWTRSDGPAAVGTKFVGWNRKSYFLWFTTCKVVTADPNKEFAFEVTSFGLPIAKWGYRFTPDGDGTSVTEYWEDRRTSGTSARVAEALGRVFTGTPAEVRGARNHLGMRTTLERMKTELSRT